MGMETQLRSLFIEGPLVIYRTSCRESWLIDAITELRAQRQRNLTAEQKKVHDIRLLREFTEFISPKVITLCTPLLFLVTIVLSISIMEFAPSLPGRLLQHYDTSRG